MAALRLVHLFPYRPIIFKSKHGRKLCQSKIMPIMDSAKIRILRKFGNLDTNGLQSVAEFSMASIEYEFV